MQQIIATAFSKGRPHDFRLFKHSCTHVRPDTMMQGDLSYLGLEQLRTHSLLPAKATKHHALTYREKQAGRNLAHLRLHIERVIGKLEVFLVLAERYQSRRQRFGLYFNLTENIYNIELVFESYLSQKVH